MNYKIGTPTMMEFWTNLFILVLVGCLASCQAHRLSRRSSWGCASGLTKTKNVELDYKTGSCRSCGASCCNENDGAAKRIANGEDAKQGEFPWSVALFEQDSHGWKFICGGVMITHEHMVTARHCIENVRDYNKVKATVGEVDIGIDGTRYRRDTRGLRSLQHKWSAEGYTKFGHQTKGIYVTGGYRYDLAVLTLKERDWSTPFVCIRPHGYPFRPKHSCVAIGHGFLKRGKFFTAKPSSILQKSTIELDHSNRCLVESGKNIFFDMLCAHKKNSTVNCKMDSGSPVVCRVDPDDDCSSYYLAGVFSSHAKVRSGDCSGGYSVLSNLLSTKEDPLVSKLQDIALVSMVSECSASPLPDQW